jgi:tRNA-specific 2-thiouridylase
MKVMVAMSGGVDSSVAAARLRDEGHDVVGVTMRLWGGESDTGCCSVSDVDDARRVAQQLDIDHVVFNFGDDFDRSVVAPYAGAHAAGTTPNPCIECNRHIKFARLAERARVLGFDAVATGHHARIRPFAGGLALERGADRAKDQSYVLHMLDQRQLARTRFPIGDLAKAEVRRIAAELGLRTAAKPDSQDVCFITSNGGRRAFLGRRIPLRPGRVVDTTGNVLAEVESIELVTVGQRHGLGLPGGGPKRYVLATDPRRATVVVGGERDLMQDAVEVHSVTWVAGAWSGDALVQCSAHGPARPATITPRAGDPDPAVTVRWAEPQRRVAPGQSVVFYDLDDRRVLGGGLASLAPR